MRLREKIKTRRSIITLDLQCQCVINQLHMQTNTLHAEAVHHDPEAISKLCNIRIGISSFVFQCELDSMHGAVV